jgi:hypothetical protein
MWVVSRGVQLIRVDPGASTCGNAYIRWKGEELCSNPANWHWGISVSIRLHFLEGSASLVQLILAGRDFCFNFTSQWTCLATLVILCLALFPVAPTLEYRASVNRSVSLQFLNPKTLGRTPRMGDQPVVRTLPIQTQTSMPWVGFEPTIPAFERAKTVHCLRPRSHCDGHSGKFVTIN